MATTNRQQPIPASSVPKEAYARLELDEFLDDNVMTNLFLISLAKMQEFNSEKDWNNFYSLSGIHFEPVELWNGVEHAKENWGGHWRGYCTHSMLTFPTWHRAYIQLFESSLKKLMVNEAKRWVGSPEEESYRTAAERFCLPYWDPVAFRNNFDAKKGKKAALGFPKILSRPEVFVNYPGRNEPVSIKNPLYSYEFPDPDKLRKVKREPIHWPKTTTEYTNKEHTIRRPDKFGNTNSANLNAAIQENGQTYAGKLWKLLSRYDDDGKKRPVRTWERFSNHLPTNRGPKPDGSTSIESWHDDIHVVVGSGAKEDGKPEHGCFGHMGDPSYAGFDPIFWLHHNNIDRILAIFQAIYPDKWVPSELPSTKVPQEQKSSSNLYPFKNPSGAFYTSVDMRAWDGLHYAVPGVSNLSEEGVNQLELYLNEHYNWLASGTTLTPPKTVFARDLSHSIALNGPNAAKDDRIQEFEALTDEGLVTRKINLSKNPIEVTDFPREVKILSIEQNRETFPNSSLSSGSLLQQRTWATQVSVKKYAYKGPFTIHLFLGDYPDNGLDYWTDTNQVGLSSIFATRKTDGCQNCQDQEELDVEYEDSIPISSYLIKYLEDETKLDPSLPKLESLEPEHVVPFLAKYLRWSIADVVSDVKSPDTYSDAGLVLTVSDRSFELPSANFPTGVYGPTSIHVDATSGQPGGYGYVYPS